jgi:Dyp-type peroxidase family
MLSLEINDIQGFILSGYGHLGHGAYHFLKFETAEDGKKWLKTIIPRLSTGKKWSIDTDGKPSSAVTLALSFAGLKVLGLSDDSLETVPTEFREGVASKRRSQILGDFDESAPENWQYGGSDQDDLHAILIILAESGDQRDELCDAFGTEFSEYNVTLIASENGDKLPDSKEHFGYHDGISQPQFETGLRKSKTSEPIIKAGEFILGYENQYDRLPWSPSLNGHDLGHNGSYLVYRKLYQDVAGYWKFVAEHSIDDVLDGTGQPLSAEERRLWLSAKFVGRWHSGAPLVMSPYRDDRSICAKDYNTFLFWDRDPEGMLCPFSSHVRRANPRDGLGPSKDSANEMSKRHLLIRRGMPYGEPLIDFDALPPEDVADDGKDRGLIFLCVNANISRQFEFVHQSWLNNPKFHGLYHDKDPIVGDNNNEYSMTIARDLVRKRVNGLPRFVTVKAGGYFFLPSISGLERIANI